MGLSPGTRLGVYELVGLLGAGGMGEVYRATDTKLGRLVAVNVLPEAFVGDRDRLARFERVHHGPIRVEEALTIAHQIAEPWKRRTRRGSSTAT